MSETIEDRGLWLQTISGTRVHPNNPRPEEFNIEDIAYGLSNMCRFCGHIKSFYSVGQHSVLGARQALVEEPKNIELAFEVLLHDGSEAYLSDIVTPAKVSLPDYGVMEDKIQGTICTRFNIVHPISARCKEIDRRMLVTEASQLMGDKVFRWWKDKTSRYYAVPYDIKITPWTPVNARRAFLSLYHKLVEKR